MGNQKDSLAGLNQKYVVSALLFIISMSIPATTHGARTPLCGSWIGHRSLCFVSGIVSVLSLDNSICNHECKLVCVPDSVVK